MEPTAFAAGNWVVQGGNEDAFVERWTALLGWTRDNVPGLEWGRLIRDGADARHFLSFARWKSPEARAAWQGDPGFAERFGACRELCDDFAGGGFELIVEVP